MDKIADRKKKHFVNAWAKFLPEDSAKIKRFCKENKILFGKFLAFSALYCYENGILPPTDDEEMPKNSQKSDV